MCQIAHSQVDLLKAVNEKDIPSSAPKLNPLWALDGFIRVLEDFIPVRKVLETKGEGRVLVVDGGGSQRRAVVGGDMAQLAHKNGWSGIVVYGSIQDVDQINGCPIGVRALSSTPSRPYDKGRCVGSKCRVYFCPQFMKFHAVHLQNYYSPCMRGVFMNI
ncbi:hypothetical protein CDL15_Pgr007155 [Punica granatum]|uniref:Oxaloacetate decarboxylase n=1 Tax=Punica granatum TaxID=22663 RepID=A0A218X840_PUNGR|nr:hypothetical protein CDL15_Pgr007155 [Punica granatum]